MKYRLGIDIGSTTIKLALIDSNDKVIYSQYRRHLSDVRGGLTALFEDLGRDNPGIHACISITGSAGLNVAKSLDITFVQEVIAATEAVERFLPETDVVIELGGEDAKITFMKPVLSQRMNGTCAGGTGAFIDQMASLLQTDASGLNELAQQHKTIYPIASRCGVFAKSDLQPLLNDGAPTADLAASVLQAVVNQTVAGLACGQPITGNIVFLGGPLHFMPQLRKRFELTLQDNAKSFTTPENGQLYVAIGAAMTAGGKEIALDSLADKMRSLSAQDNEIQRMGKLFKTEQEKKDFYERHSKARAKSGDITKAAGPCFLGVDAGSTTIKAALTNEKGELLYTYYNSNKGNPIKYAIKILKEIYAQLPDNAYIANACVTGYGEALLKTALCFDEGEVETLSHYKAAEFFAPDVDYIIDIGGQDMKCIKIRDKVIDSVVLNEACSSGCGSFIQAFAKSLSLEPEEFSKAAIESENPVDLGTRCTVFMNSRVKQAQKEGATPGDISAGLSYSVVRNALYKVVKLKSPDDLGDKVLVQGGTFLNDAILRCFELISGKEVIRPNIAGLMGAFGAARIAKERWQGGVSSLLSLKQLENEFSMTTKAANCKGCSNNCKLTITTFDNGRRLITGNRCERGAGNIEKASDVSNLFDYKYHRLFDYEPLAEKDAPRGTVGIPRALNLYEDYPFWFTLLTNLGFRVVLSRQSDHQLFEEGMSTIPSESVCYPAKLAHGHIMDLIEKGISFIFYPCLPYSKKEDENAGNHYNCPIVTSYPEVIWNNMEILREKNIRFKKPFLSKDNPKKLTERMIEEFKEFGVTKAEAKRAVDAAYLEHEKFKADIRAEGEKILKELDKSGKTGIVIAGRPYHVDPEINHGIPAMIASLGLAVLTEDSIAHLGTAERPLRVVDQWVYHTRLYNAAQAVTEHDNLQLVQLNSFGCGLDAVTTDQVQEILEAGNKIYTCLKIDEISNLGAARIRARSLKVAIEERAQNKEKLPKHSYQQQRVIFTKEMRKEHTIIAPQMAPVQFDLIEAAFRNAGYRLEVLKKATPEDVETGLKYVNNDACYPTIIVIGQLIHALQSGKYDPENTSIFITQTGGGCRATNYIAFLRKALKDSGFSQVPVVSLNMSGLEKNPGLKFTPKLLNDAVHGLIYGDVLQKVVLRTRPYELVQGSANQLYEKWNTICKDSFSKDVGMKYHEILQGIIKDFDELPLNENIVKPKVGLVGEILVKFQPDANNHAIDVVEKEGCEAVVPGLTDFFLYCFSNGQFKYDKLGKGYWAAVGGNLLVKLIEKYRKPANEAFKQSKRFSPSNNIYEIQEHAGHILSIGNTCGEGWLLTGEMIELIQEGVPNIICAQPFACLPNHVTGKGMIKELRRQYPESNIVAIDYDPGASEVNQLNRIKLMISTAFKRLKQQNIIAKTEDNASEKIHMITAKQTESAN